MLPSVRGSWLMSFLVIVSSSSVLGVSWRYVQLLKSTVGVGDICSFRVTVGLWFVSHSSSSMLRMLLSLVGAGRRVCGRGGSRRKKWRACQSIVVISGPSTPAVVLHEQLSAAAATGYSHPSAARAAQIITTTQHSAVSASVGSCSGQSRSQTIKDGHTYHIGRIYGGCRPPCCKD